MRAVSLMVGLLCTGPAVSWAEAPASKGEKVERTLAHYELPDVTLTDQDGKPVKLKATFDAKQPYFVQFVFTSCTNICPVLGAIFANLQKQVGPAGDSVPYLSVSIDPENDTPEKMKKFLARYSAKPNWRFVTGRREDIVTVTRAFDAAVGNKMGHAPLTIMWSPAEQAWVRLKGFVGSAELVDEFNKATAK